MKKKPYEKYFNLFNKYLLLIAITKSKPRVWFSFNRSTNRREINYFSISTIKYSINLKKQISKCLCFKNYTWSCCDSNN